MNVLVRSDGRVYGELRELTVEYDGLDRADGSARFGFGETKGLASVSGPIEVRLAAEQPSRATFEVLVRPLSNIPGTESKALASTLRALLTPSLLLTHNPRTLIQLVAQSLTPTPTPHFPPALVAALVNAATLALLNAASVPMRGVTCAVAVGRSRFPNATPDLLLDPTDEEAASLAGGGCFAFLFGVGVGGQDGVATPPSELVWTSWQATTPSDEGELARASELARGGAERVWATMRESVEWMGAPFQMPQWKEARLRTAAAHSKEGGDDAKMEI